MPKTPRLEVCSPRDVLPLLVPMVGCHSFCRKVLTVRSWGPNNCAVKLEVFGVLRKCQLLQPDDGDNTLFRNVDDISPAVES
jgi:hypothetical protein